VHECFKIPHPAKIFLQFNKGIPYIFACHLPAINNGCFENDLILFLTTAGISDIHLQEFKRSDTKFVAEIHS